MNAKFLLYKKEVCSEVRPLYFYQAFGQQIPQGRIFSFGACNFNCSYCKRGCTFQYPNGSIIASVSKDIKSIFKICDDTIEQKQIVRLSGGDPVAFPKASIAIASYVKSKNGRVSLAHNGSSPAFTERMIPFIESAAIDLKATRQTMSIVTGLDDKIAQRAYDSSLQTQFLLSSNKILLDVRTPIFDFTTLDDLLLLASDISKSGNYNTIFWTLRIYENVVGCSFRSMRKENVLWMAKEVKKVFVKLKIGIRHNWESDVKFIFL